MFLEDTLRGVKIKNNSAFGYELLLDLYNCKPGVCDDLDLCYQFLDEIVGYLGMEKQAPPNIFRSDGVRFPDKAGLSGWAPLIESSIVIHTLTPKNFISIDIYCCKEFDNEKARDFVRRYFSPDRMDEQFIFRGVDYYQEPKETKDTVIKPEKQHKSYKRGIDDNSLVVCDSKSKT